MKAPAFQFYVMDWMTDLDDHPLEIEGAWIRICCKLWRAEIRGELSKTILQWSRILRVDLDKTKEIIDYISNEKIGDVMPCNVFELKNNSKVTVKNRRMVRDRIDKEKNRIRVERYRAKKKSNGAGNGKVTPPSSTSSSTSSSKQPGKGNPRPLKISYLGGVYLEEILKKCRTIHDLQLQEGGDKKINVEAWVNQSVGAGGHPKAIDYALDHLIGRWKSVLDPWPYIESIFRMKNGNFWESEYIEESKKFKIEWDSVDDKIKGLIEKINNGGG